MSDPAYDYAPGSLATLRLDAFPADGTTAGTVLATAPDGTVSTPPVTGSLSGSTWTGTAPLTLTMAGVWTASWTVTGTGAGKRPQRLTVGPAQPQTGRSYATTEDLANWLDTTAPTGAAKLLRDATRAIDKLLITAVYDVGTDDLPTDTDVIIALRDATCAQVEWWQATGDQLGAAGIFQSVSIGSVSLSRGGSGSTAAAIRTSSVAVDILRQAGLLGHGPWAR